MLYKKELAAFPTPPFPNVKRENLGCHGIDRYAVVAQKTTLPRSGEVLIVDFYAWEDQLPKRRFVSDGKNFCTAEYPITVWRQNDPTGDLGYGRVSEAPGAGMMAAEFLHYRWHGPTVKEAVHDFCQSVGQNRRYRSYLAKVDLRHAHIAMYPELPADLDTYCEENVFLTGYGFYSKIQPHGGRDGHCSRCRQSFRLPAQMKHNDKGACPHCGRELTWKADFHRGMISESDQICVANKVDGQLLLRWLNVTRQYVPPKYECKYYFYPYAYNLYLKGGKIYFYKKINHGYDWYRGRLGETCYDVTRVYAGNLAEVFGRDYYHVDLEKGLAGPHHKVAFCKLLDNLKNEPAAEYLFKMGLPRVASEFQPGRKLEGKQGFREYLGIGREYLPMLRKVDASHREVKLIRDAGCNVTEEMLLRWRALEIQYYYDEDVRNLLRQVSFHQFLNYMEKQKAVLKLSTASVLTFWGDYLGMCQVMQIPLTDKSHRMPKNIKEAHDRLLTAKESRDAEFKDKVYATAVESLYETMHFDPYSKDGLTVRLPYHVMDLVREGECLGHCVGRFGYDDKTVRGESCILFIREEKEPEKPFYTMEYDLRDRHIRQLYGKGNKAATPAVRKFAEAYIRRVKPRKMQEEKTA